MKKFLAVVLAAVISTAASAQQAWNAPLNVKDMALGLAEMNALAPGAMTCMDRAQMMALAIPGATVATSAKQNHMVNVIDGRLFDAQVGQALYQLFGKVYSIEAMLDPAYGEARETFLKEVVVAVQQNSSTTCTWNGRTVRYNGYPSNDYMIWESYDKAAASGGEWRQTVDKFHMSGSGADEEVRDLFAALLKSYSIKSAGITEVTGWMLSAPEDNAFDIIVYGNNSKGEPTKKQVWCDGGLAEYEQYFSGWISSLYTQAGLRWSYASTLIFEYMPQRLNIVRISW